MIILGINIGHDSGAALIIDDNIISCINEERLSRIKMHHGFPYLSINEILSIGQINLGKIDVISVEGKNMLPFSEINFDKNQDSKKYFLGLFSIEKLLLGSKFGIMLCGLLFKFNYYLTKSKIKRYFLKKGFRGKFKFYDHHLCHAATAYYTQSKDCGLAITLDASGEGYCSRVFICKNWEMKEVHSLTCFFSPAYYYAYITQLLGFIPLRHEGKITGLAAFGSPVKTLPILENFLSYNSNKLTFINQGGFYTKAIDKLKEALSGFSREDIASGIQALTEKVVVNYIIDCINKYSDKKNKNVFLAGGIFSNVKLNQKINENSNVDYLYIFPNMGDGGLGLGAALAERRRFTKLNNLYLGRNFVNYDFEKLLLSYNLYYKKFDNISRQIAIELSNKKIVGIFFGRMEYGPRSLGGRSILYSASDINLNTFLNFKLGRTEFMPFAPVVRDIDAEKYFLIKKNSTNFSFMTLSCNVTEHCSKVAPAITHVDMTARPQILASVDNKVYYDILSEYDQITGEGILVNTSFNMHEEPIVNTPIEAINTFIKSELDCLVLENYLIYRIN